MVYGKRNTAYRQIYAYMDPYSIDFYIQSIKYAKYIKAKSKKRVTWKYGYKI